MLKKYDKENVDELYSLLRRRGEELSPEIMNTVSSVLADVRENGDAALRKYTEKFDVVKLDSLYMSEAEIEERVALVPVSLRNVIDKAAANIRAFHEGQVQQSRMIAEDGRIMGQRVMPLRRVGLYVPGGSAAYPSSVLMNAIPASVAGVEDIIMATPPKKDGVNPAVLYAAKTAGVKTILKVGGAQAIAALAYGTESVERVDKIVGPGNIFVAMAKKLVYGTVDIDMIAGPSEILIIADETADPGYVAADLLSQAEHDPMAAAILITDSSSLADKVQTALEEQQSKLTRREIAGKSIYSYGSLVVTDDLDDAAAIANRIAPEHLELSVKAPMDMLPKIRNAGSVFLGSYAPEPLGDYFAGPNHVLPTNGTARFASPLSVDSFIKKSSFLYYTRDALLEVADDVAAFADAEGLGAHANSIRIRKNK